MTGARAIVVGAGIGGLAAALALTNSGWSVTVLERGSADRQAGSGLSLWPNALRALAELGVENLMEPGATLGGRSGVRTPSGTWIGHTDIGAAIVGRYGLPLVLTQRETVLLALRAKLELAGVRVDFGVTVLEIATGHASATVSTAHEIHTADLIVVADGSRSRLRPQLFPGQPGLRYAGYTTWRMLTRRPDADIEPSETWGPAGQRFAILPVAEDRLYCYATANEAAGRTAADERIQLRERFGAWHAPIPEIIDSLDHSAVIRTDVFELSAPLSTYRRGRAVLLGDAAHAMTPDLGQGACQALEDAVTLGIVLGDGRTIEPATIERALDRYSTLRAPRGADLIRRSHAAGRIYQAPVLVARAGAWAAGRLPVRALDPILSWRPPTRSE